MYKSGHVYVCWDRRDRNRILYCIVVGFTTAIELRPSMVYWMQHYVIKFVSDLRQFGGFLWVLRFPQPIKLTAMK